MRKTPGKPQRKTRTTRATTLEDLRPDPSNRRAHPERNLGMTVEALKKIGAARSIVIDEDNLVLAGNGVTEAAKAVGLTKLHIVDADGDTLVAVRRRGLTEAQKRDLAIYDNRTSELAEWNLAQLAADLKNGEDLGAFFFDGELASLGLIGDQVAHTDREWSGLPEYEQADQSAFHTLHIHFKDAAAMTAFGELIGQVLTKQVRFLWVPPVERANFRDREYAEGEP